MSETNPSNASTFVVGSDADPYKPHLTSMKDKVKGLRDNNEIAQLFYSLFEGMKGSDAEKMRLPIPLIKDTLKEDMDKKYGTNVMKEIKSVIG